MNPEILKIIEILSKKTVKDHYSTTYEDLVHDGMVLVMQLYKRKPNADAEWIFKALHNFYATKRRNMRRKEYREKHESASLKELEEVPDDNGEIPQEKATEAPHPDLDILQIAQLVEIGLSKEDILKTLNISARELRRRLGGEEGGE